MFRYKKRVFTIIIGILFLQAVALKTMETSKENSQNKTIEFDYKPLDKDLYKKRAKELLKYLEIKCEDEYYDTREYLEHRIRSAEKIISGKFTKEELDFEYNKILNYHIYSYTLFEFLDLKFCPSAIAMYYFPKMLAKNIKFILQKKPKGLNQINLNQIKIRESKRFAEYILEAITSDIIKN